MQNENSVRPDPTKVFMYGVKPWIRYFGILWFGLFTLVGWYLISTGKTAVDIKYNLDGILVLLAMVFFTFFFVFGVAQQLRGIGVRVPILIYEDGFEIPQWGWKKRELKVLFNDIAKTNWVPGRYGTYFQLRMASGEKALFWSFAFQSLSQYQEFILIVKTGIR